MKKLFSVFLLLALLLGACSPGASIPTATATQTSAATENAATETILPTPSTRTAVLTKIENTVSMRATASDTFSAATTGMIIPTNGGVETGSDGRARLDLLPDGTIVRVGPNSSFNVPELTVVNGQPKTTLELVFGKVYILLNGGSLDIKTPIGIASVRGSVLSVVYDPATKRVTASCLEGHCALGDEQGNEVPLTQDQASFIDPGKLPVEPIKVERSEVQDWLDQVPEMPGFFQVLPDPQNYSTPDSVDKGNNGSDPSSNPDMTIQKPAEKPKDKVKDKGNDKGRNGGGHNGGPGGGGPGGGGNGHGHGGG